MSVHVLQFMATLDNGGAENRMADVYKCIDSDVVTFDFAVVYEGEHYFDAFIKEKGSEKFCFPNPHNGLIRNYKALAAFFKEHSFQAVHAHVAWYAGIVLLAAKKGGVKIRIAHARDSVNPNRSMKEKLAANIGKFLIARTATQRIAISKEAAENVFGKRAVRKNEYLYVPNAIDQKKYAVLEKDARQALRKQLGIPDDKKAYVTVANLRRQKNHLFLLQIAKALKDKGDSFVLYLIGEGDQRSAIEECIRELALDDCVILLGSRGDVPEILCAFDVMIFPSLYEGLGGVVLESQLVGVPAVVSENIPHAADVGIGLVAYMSLAQSPEDWADAVISSTKICSPDHQETLQAFSKAGYSIEQTAITYLKEYGIDDSTIHKALLPSEN